MVIASSVPAVLGKTPALLWHKYVAAHECWPAVLRLRHRTISPFWLPCPQHGQNEMRGAIIPESLQWQETDGTGDFSEEQMKPMEESYSG